MTAPTRVALSNAGPARCGGSGAAAGACKHRDVPGPTGLKNTGPPSKSNGRPGTESELLGHALDQEVKLSALPWGPCPLWSCSGRQCLR